jgi:hypothetical protein
MKTVPWNINCKPPKKIVLRKGKLGMEKPVITQKLVLKTTQICVTATQKFSTQARFQHKRDFEHNSFVCLLYQILDLGPCLKLFLRKAHCRRLGDRKTLLALEALTYHTMLN